MKGKGGRGLNPKTTFYHTNGTGRDTYISGDNGGCVKQQAFNTSNRPATSYVPLKSEHRAKFQSGAKVFRYASNGTGRDTYVGNDFGGLVKTGTPLSVYNDYVGGLRTWGAMNRGMARSWPPQFRPSSKLYQIKNVPSNHEALESTPHMAIQGTHITRQRPSTAQEGRSRTFQVNPNRKSYQHLVHSLQDHPLGFDSTLLANQPGDTPAVNPTKGEPIIAAVRPRPQTAMPGVSRPKPVSQEVADAAIAVGKVETTSPPQATIDQVYRPLGRPLSAKQLSQIHLSGVLSQPKWKEVPFESQVRVINLRNHRCPYSRDRLYQNWNQIYDHQY